jgi:hypothetical protein
MQIKNTIITAWSFSFILITAAMVFFSPDARYAAAPGFACVLLMLWLFTTLYERDKQIPFFDVGIFCALVIFVYTVLPLLAYIAGDFKFNFFTDSRLLEHSPTPDQLFFFHTRHLLYFFSFVISYLSIRGKGTIQTGNIVEPLRSLEIKILILFIGLNAYFIFLYLFFGLTFNFGYNQQSVENYYAAIENLPQIIFKISAKLHGILFVFKIALLYCVVRRCHLKKWKLILGFWISYEVAKVVVVMGARTELFLFILAAILFYHRQVKMFSIKYLTVFGTILLLTFLFLGFYRGATDPSTLLTPLLSANEFLVLLGNAMHIHSMKEAGFNFPLILYFNDFLGLLPPQEILPFEKIAASNWYLRYLGVEGTAFGYMWGVISQSIIGFDRFELVCRGAILGALLGFLHRWYFYNQRNYIASLFYVFICIKVYSTFRDTTFSILTNIVWEFVPFLLLLTIGLQKKHLSVHQWK